jgi:hypothetical protein
MEDMNTRERALCGHEDTRHHSAFAAFLRQSSELRARIKSSVTLNTTIYQIDFVSNKRRECFAAHAFMKFVG